VASWLFQHSARRALDEALLAAMTVAVTAIFAWRVWHHTAPFTVARVTNRDRASRWAVTTLAALIVVRQTMEMGSVLAAAIDVRLVVPAAAVLGALTVGGCAAWGARRLAMRLPDREITATMQLFAVIFFVQGVIYAFHGSRKPGAGTRRPALGERACGRTASTVFTSAICSSSRAARRRRLRGCAQGALR
jgi:hypothetical protein